MEMLTDATNVKLYQALLSYFISVWEAFRKEWYICFMGSISFAKNYQMASW